MKTGASMRVIVIEDSEDDYLLLVRHLEKQGLQVKSVRLETGDDFRRTLKEQTWDLVLSDYLLPQFSGLQALQIIHSLGLDLPFILISGAIGEDLAVEAMRSGAHDYIAKGNLARLVPAIERELRESSGRSLRRQAEGALRESEARYRLLVEQSPDAICIDQDGKMVFANSMAVKLFGAGSPQQLLQHSLINRIHPTFRRNFEDQVLHLTRGIKSFFLVSGKVIKLDGSTVDVEVSASTFKLDKKVSLQVVIRDLTDRRNLEAQLLHAQKMEAVGQLAAGVAHDFNNILTIIQGHVGLLRVKSLGKVDMVEPLEKVASAADRAAALTRQLLTFSHKQVVELRLLDLNEIIQSVISMLHRGLGEDIILTFKPTASLPSIHGDKTMMEQILMNLAVNSRDAMPKGGQLTIETHHVLLGQDYADQHPNSRPGSFIKCSVADTGTGMDAKTLARIFEPFFTTKEVGKGTGLGLATVYAIVRQHHGWVDVDSVLGKGTSFHIFLPASDFQPAPKARHQAQQRPSRGQGETLLVVEDEPVVRALVKQILQENNYIVLEAESGLKAREIWRQKNGNVDLLLTDMVMPDGVTGQELAEELVAEKPGLKVIFTSGYSKELLKPDMAFKPTHFLHKPYLPEKLLTVIYESLH